MTSSISDPELTSARAEAAKLLPGTAVYSRRSFTSDGMGGGTAAFAPAGTAACRISPISGDEREVADRVAEVSNWIVTFAHGVSITTTDRLTIGGTDYEVTAVESPRSYEIQTRVFANEVS